MDHAENFSSALNPVVLARKSWVAYIAPSVFYSAALYFLSSFAWEVSEIGALAVTFVCVAVYLYTLLSIRSYMLFYNENGVWVFEGVLPWTKGVSGVKWRDLDEAVYYQNFLSWIFRAYTVRISHRFTRASEIRLSAMHMGQTAVQRINAVHQTLLAKSANALQDEAAITAKEGPE